MGTTLPPPKIVRDDFSDILAVFNDRNWERVKSIAVPNVGDEEIVRTIPDIPVAKTEKCKQFADLFTDAKNAVQQKYVVDPVVDREVKKGVYRLVSNEISRLNTGFRGLVQTLRKGFARELIWSEARIVSGNYADANTQSVTGVDNSASDNPQRYFIIEFPNCDNGYVSAIAASAAATYTTFTAEGKTITGAFHTLIRSGEKGNDGAGSVKLVLAEPQYTLSGFTDYLGSNSKAVHYLNEVPQTIAQSILTAWKVGEGRSAQMRSYNNESKTVDLALWSYEGTAPNLNVTGFQEHCDTTLNIYFAWRYTKAQVSTFFASHSAPSMTGVTRKVQVNERGDGFFDVTIFETTVAYDADKHKVVFDILGAADKVIKKVEWGWNIPITNLLELKTNYKAETLGEGYTTDFKLTRNDNCTFDYEGVIVQEKYRYFLNAVQGTLKEPVYVYSGESAKSTEVPEAVTGDLVIGEERTVSIRLRENNLVDFVCLKKTSDPYELAASVVGGDKYTKLEQAKKRNQTASSALIAQPTTVGVTRKGSIEPHANGTFDAELQDETRSPFELAEQVVGGSITEELKLEKKIAQVAAPTIARPEEAGTEVEADVTPLSDGTFEHTKRSRVAVQTDGPTLVDGGVWKARRTRTSSINDTVDNAERENVSSTPVRGTMTILRGELNPKNGTVDWVKDVIVSTPRNWGAYSYSNDNAITILIKAEWYINQTTLPNFNASSMTLTAPTPEAGSDVEIRDPEMNDDGTFNYIKITTTVTLSASAQSGIIIKASDEVVRDEMPVSTKIRTSGIVSMILISTTRWLELILYNRVCRVTSTTTRKFSTTYPTLNSADYTVGPPNTGTNNGTAKSSEIIQLTKNLYAVDVFYTYKSAWQDNTGAGLNYGIRAIQRQIPAAT